MKVKEVIKDLKGHYTVTQDGKILAICNDSGVSFGYNNGDEVLNMEVKEVNKITGVIEDLTAIRV